MLIADIFLLTLIDSNGKAICTSTLQNAGIEVAVNSTEVRGGRGNTLLATLHSDRDITLNITDAEFKYEFLAKQLGSDIVTGAGTAYAAPKRYTVGSDSTITLEETPVAQDNGLQIYDRDGKEFTSAVSSPTDSQYSISGNTVTFHSGMKGKNVEVRTYKYTTDAKTQTIVIDNSKFPTGLQAVLETIEIDNDTTPKYRLIYNFYQAVPTGAFSINTTSDRTANAQQFNLRVIKPSNEDTKIGEVLRIPIS